MAGRAIRESGALALFRPRQELRSQAGLRRAGDGGEVVSIGLPACPS